MSEKVTNTEKILKKAIVNTDSPGNDSASVCGLKAQPDKVVEPIRTLIEAKNGINWLRIVM